MPHALILFDIDGTLMITKGAGSRCLRQAGREAFGEAFQWCAVTSGLLDQQIYQELASHNGVENAMTSHEQFRDIYLQALEQELARVKADVTVLPGVRDMLAALRERSDVVLGLLSGNYRQAARLKLTAAEIDWSQFEVTALAEDATCRDDLVPVAIAQYRALTGEAIRPDRVAIVGDTPRDVTCAHAHGCGLVAVATGQFSEQQLRDAGAACVLPNLADANSHTAVLQCVGLAEMPATSD